jgi:hypothetical protein
MNSLGAGCEQDLKIVAVETELLFTCHLSQKITDLSRSSELVSRLCICLRISLAKTA